MEQSEMIRDSIFEIIDEQIKENDPSETVETKQRLEKKGFSEYEAKQLIGQCVSYELFQIIKNQQPFNLDRYLKNLKNLPKEPNK